MEKGVAMNNKQTLTMEEAIDILRIAGFDVHILTHRANDHTGVSAHIYRIDMPETILGVLTGRDMPAQNIKNFIDKYSDQPIKDYPWNV